MLDNQWRPLRARKAGKQEKFDSLVEGVPPWLRQVLIDWLNDHFLLEDTFGAPDRDVLHHVELSLRVGLSWFVGEHNALASLWEKCEKDEDLFLSVLDLALRDLGGNEENNTAIDRLNYLLAAGGSAWMVALDRRSLVKRVQPEVVQAARRVIQSGSPAAPYLAEAWRHTYGRNPNPSSGYREAVRAVEAAVCPVIIPKNRKPTLGRAIAALHEAPPGNFATVFEDNAPDIKPLDAVLGLMRLVWTNQLDRHGTADEDAPLHVSQQQAEAALYAAVTLVQWFQCGVVRRAKE